MKKAVIGFWMLVMVGVCGVSWAGAGQAAPLKETPAVVSGYGSLPLSFVGQQAPFAAPDPTRHPPKSPPSVS